MHVTRYTWWKTPAKKAREIFYTRTHVRRVLMMGFPVAEFMIECIPRLFRGARRPALNARLTCFWSRAHTRTRNSRTNTHTHIARIFRCVRVRRELHSLAYVSRPPETRSGSRACVFDNCCVHVFIVGIRGRQARAIVMHAHAIENIGFTLLDFMVNIINLVRSVQPIECGQTVRAVIPECA